MRTEEIVVSLIYGINDCSGELINLDILLEREENILIIKRGKDRLRFSAEILRNISILWPGNSRDSLVSQIYRWKFFADISVRDKWSTEM